MMPRGRRRGVDEVARLASQDRSDLFRAAAEAKGVTIQIIEKDFWVCWVLRQLYTLDTLPAELLFKGGTSLSKVFGVIDRMSEDIDLVIDRAGLGFTGDRDPTDEELGGKERERRIDALKQAAASFVGGPLTDALRARFEAVLGPPNSWSLRTDLTNLDNTLILFGYPSIETASSYLRPMVQLELGARGDTWPAAEGGVTPYAAELFPGLFREPTARVRVITAERTFWEKVTILHALAHQGAEKAKRLKPARHYHDVHRLWEHGLGRAAAGDHALLADVVRHKSTFYREPKARYDLAIPGSLRLVPGDDVVSAIRSDYAVMAEEMVFGNAPTLEEVLRVLAEIEFAVNG
jgi:hypothetical protein